MVGKASLYLILGFSLIFLVFGQRFGSLTNQAVDNMTNYYAETVSHDCAVTGANMAANKVFLNNKWNAGFSNLSFNGGKINVSVQHVYSYGDSLIKITSTGTYEESSHKSVVILRPSKFSKFAYYSVLEKDPDGDVIWWTAKDTIWGPFHTQDYMHVANHPVFHGKVTTAKNDIIYYTSKNSDYPVIDGDFQKNIDLPLPYNSILDLKSAAIQGGKDIPQTSTNTTTTQQTWVDGYYQGSGWSKKWIPGHYETTTTTTSTSDTVYITFVKDSVQIKMGITKPSTTYKTSVIAPNGVIFVEGMNTRLKGTVKGQFTVGCDKDIYLDDNIVYNTDPLKNSTDVLGIVAKNNILITDNSPNGHDINIDASLYSQEGGIGAENYSTGSPRGNINLIGGIIQYERQPVGQFNASNNGNGKSEAVHGYSKRYKYDNRLSTISPPFFPNTGKFEVVSWLEE